MQKKYEKGDAIAFQNQWGDISIYKYHSMYNDETVNVYLSFDMSTEHTHLKPVRNIVPLEKLKKMLFGDV